MVFREVPHVHIPIPSRVFDTIKSVAGGGKGMAHGTHLNGELLQHAQPLNLKSCKAEGEALKHEHLSSSTLY